MDRMEGYDSRTYGDAFADVYDDWYSGISSIEATVATLLTLAGDGPVLELGVGTGRLAVPLAAAGARVVGVDTSPAMLARLAERDPAGSVEPVLGDMVDGLPDGPFTLAFVAYNTIFNLTGDGEQARCFDAVAARLVAGGRFVVEAFVPADPPPSGDVVGIRTMAADRVVLSLTRNDPDRSAASGQFVELTESGGVRLRPWSIRYATPSELDAHAAAAGFTVEHRWEQFTRDPFDAGSSRHVTVYRLATE